MKFFKILILFILPLSLFAWKMESGTVTLPATTIGSSTWQVKYLQQSYDVTPLIFVMPDEGSGYDGDTPASVRIRAVGTDSFEILQVEPQSSVGDVEGEHAAMTVHYIAIEPGDYTLPDGTRILANTHETVTKQGKNVSNPKDWDNIAISPAFSSTPIVLTMIQSLVNENSTLPNDSSSPWMTAHIRGVGIGDFDVTLDRSETSTGSIVNDETIGYFAIDSGVSGTIFSLSRQSIFYQTINTGDNIRGWENECYSQDFGKSYASSPNVLGSLQSRGGGDGGWLRRCDISSSSVGIAVDEDQAADSERKHTTETVGLVVFSQDFVYDSTFNTIGLGLVAEYRMDECYWLNNTGGAIGDVKDSSQNIYNATSYNTAGINTNGKINSSGVFTVDEDLVEAEDNTVGNTNSALSVSFWVKLDQQLGRYAVVLTKSKDWDWNDGWGFVNPTSGASDTLRFYINSFAGTHINTTLTTADGWTHFMGTYDGENLRLYKNGTEVSGSPVADTTGITNSSDPIRMAFDNSGDATLKGNLDEVKVWTRVLSSEEVTSIESNESIGKNYDGTSREPITCESNITAGAWELVGIPADLRTETNKDVADIFDEFVSADYGDPDALSSWVLFKRTYSDTNNSSSYSIVPYTGESLEFGQGYWLRSRVSNNWSENGLQGVDYNSADSACPAARCIEIDLKSVNLNFDTPDNDTDDGTGPDRNNMLGFVGKSPVEWADCRIVIDGTAYTATNADTAGYIDKQIWQYNSGNPGANANGYTTCDDSLTSCKLEPYKGFWIKLHGKTKNKTVKLLIPQE